MSVDLLSERGRDMPLQNDTALTHTVAAQCSSKVAATRYKL